LQPLNPPALEAKSISAAYGTYRALCGVTVSLPGSDGVEGSSLALIGPNGAGKSTLLRVMSGLLRPTEGSVTFQSKDITSTSAWLRARMLLTHIPEDKAIFSSLTVFENIELRIRQILNHTRSDAIEEVLERFPKLSERRKQVAGTLSGGEQRLLAFAPLFAIKPVVLLVDELSLGLSPGVLADMYEVLRQLRDQGTSMIIVDQAQDRVTEFAGSTVVLDKGRVVSGGA
jgi:ABC-type branched-subunit amino acid transport system ATPase component